MTGLHDGDDDELYGCQTPGLDKLLRVYSAALQLVYVVGNLKLNTLAGTSCPRPRRPSTMTWRHLCFQLRAHRISPWIDIFL
jgi:hypothetical protein